ncbi:MAG: THUMP domain-containing protein [Anaerovoracaceae bacterium]
MVKANLWLRSADRVLIKMAEFEALEFEELFQQVKAIPWEEWIPPDGKFIVNGSSVKSKLSSVPACQSVAEKAIVERLREIYAVDYFEKSGALYDIKISFSRTE